jgi:guanosine-3',5'-bis(diphosphate) 3'-pyrophosphohydrolase
MFAPVDYSPAPINKVASYSMVFDATHRVLNVVTNGNKSVETVFISFKEALCNSSLTVLQYDDILDTVQYAAQKHRFQTRKNYEKTPYIIHPIGVALSILMEAQIELTEILQIALLHDTLEDTDATYEEIAAKFGYHVAGSVKELSDEVGEPGRKTQDQATRKRLEIEHAGKLSFDATVVKLADKLYNLRDLIDNPPATWSNERFIGYADFVEQILNHIVSHHEDKAHIKGFHGLLKLEQLVQEQISRVRDHYKTK